MTENIDTKETPRIDLPHLPILLQDDAVLLFDADGRTVDGNLQAKLEKHGRKKESRPCHGVVVGVKTVAKVEGETVRAH